jgi:hypothetical protein
VTLNELDALTSEATAEWNQIARDDWIYTATLFAWSHKPEGDLVSLAGTGRLVSYRDEHYILTAAHAWHQVLKRADRVGITLREVNDHSCLMETRIGRRPERCCFLCLRCAERRGHGSLSWPAQHRRSDVEPDSMSTVIGHSTAILRL